MSLISHTSNEDKLEVLEEILKISSNNFKKFDTSLVKKSFELCTNTFKDIILDSGEPYYTQTIEVAKYIANQFILDDVSIICSLLQDIQYYSPTHNYDYIKSEYGETVAEIVDGLYKIKKAEFLEKDDQNNLESFRRILFSLFDDIRIILIKLVERLIFMRNLKFYPAPERIKYSNEIMEVYVPFANRFGLTNLKWEMEDLYFKYTNPEEYDKIRKSLFGTRKDREEYIKHFADPVKEKLSSDGILSLHNIAFEVKGRAKHIYSIYNKIIARQKPLEELYDLVAMRVIIDTDNPLFCFYVYGIIASIYPPVPETFKDYISAPKPNGYQSIHVGVMGPTQKPVEVQIRTKLMHDVSESGVAAHFNYKRGFIPAQSVLDNRNAVEWMLSVKEIFEHTTSNTNDASLLDTIKKNMFLDEIHIFTPKNKIMTFPKGSTPLDFAFHLHTELGYHCIGAKVNGKEVPLDFKLKSGDQIEIITSDTQKPQKDWIDLVFTSKSKSIIMKYFKNEEKKLHTIGFNLWKDRIQNSGFKMNKTIFTKMLETLNIEDEITFYRSLGEGTLNIENVLEYLKYKNTYNKKRRLSNKLDEDIDIDNDINIIVEFEVIAKNQMSLISDIVTTIINISGIDIIKFSHTQLDSGMKFHFKLEFQNNRIFRIFKEDLNKLNGILDFKFNRLLN